MAYDIRGIVAAIVAAPAGSGGERAPAIRPTGVGGTSYCRPDRRSTAVNVFTVGPTDRRRRADCGGALPNVAPTPDPDTEEISRETLSADAVGEAAHGKEEPVETDPDARERSGRDE